MDSITDLLKDVEQSVDKFYTQAIEYHNNKSLRSLAGTAIPILVPQQGYYRLYYGSEGFYAGIPKYVDGDWDDGGYYRYVDHNFKESDNRLVVKEKGLQEMLHMFPELSLGTLESKLSEGIKKSGLLKCDS